MINPAHIKRMSMVMPQTIAGVPVVSDYKYLGILISYDWERVLREAFVRYGQIKKPWHGFLIENDNNFDITA